MLAADWLPADLGRIYGVGLDSSGRVVKGVGTTGVIGVLVLTKARKAGEIVDVMTAGEIVEFCDTVQVQGTDVGVAGKPYYAHTATASEVQSIDTTGTPEGGTFKLSFRGQETTALNYNATAANIHDALEALTTIGSGQLTGGGGALPTAVTITFGGTLANVDVPLLVVSDNSLTGGTAPTVTVESTTEGHSASGEVNSAAGAGAVYIGHTAEGGRLVVRVRPALGAGTVDIGDIAATGTPGGTNYLKGDASWGTV